MSNNHRLAITAQAPGERSTITIDGHDISNALTGLTLEIGVGKVPTATLDLLLIDTTEYQDAETRILIPEATRDTLVALGWTPPEQSDTAKPSPMDDVCVHFSEHGWGRCVEPRGHAPGKHMYRNPKRP